MERKTKLFKWLIAILSVSLFVIGFFLVPKFVYENKLRAYYQNHYEIDAAYYEDIICGIETGTYLVSDTERQELAQELEDWAEELQAQKETAMSINWLLNSEINNAFNSIDILEIKLLSSWLLYGI